MELWELTACLIAYAESQKEIGKLRTTQAWQAGFFVNQAFNGKLKDLTEYIGDGAAKAAEPITKDDFDAGLARAEASAKYGKH